MKSSPLDSPLLQEDISASKDLPSSSSSYAKGFLFFSSFYSPCLPWRDSELLEEIKQQLGLAAPLIAVSLFQFLLQMISLMFAGHLGELALAGASMATSFANVTGFSLLLGMGSALDTLCGQAYGAKQYYNLGIHMQRAMLVLSLASVPLAFIWAYTRQILMYLGQNSEISREAGLYANGLIPGIFAYGLLQCHIRFLQTQNIVIPMLISSGIAALMHIFICWILVYGFSFGSKGASLATSISCWMNVSLLAIYVNFSKACKETWTGPSMEALYNILNFVRLAVPSALMVWILLNRLHSYFSDDRVPFDCTASLVCICFIFEYWSFEMVVLLSGILPNPKLETSVLSISLNTMWMVYMIPTGLGSAVSIRVSNELGAGNSHAARLSVQAVFVIVIAQGLLIALSTILVRDYWGYLFSYEEEVVRYVSAMMPILATSNFLDGVQCALSGAARGCGWQNICSVINLCAYYVVGIPSSILFAFVFHLGGKGLWLGIVCALTIQALVLIIMNLRTDWDNETKKTRDRLHSSTIVATAF